jgi:hypothetical protein
MDKMGSKMRKIRLKGRLLFLALTVLGLVSLNVCLAEPAEMGEIGNAARNGPSQDNGPHIPPFGNMDGAPAGIIIHHWQGFALKGDQSYILRVSIEGVRPVGPVNVRKLLASNKTLEEVGREILAEEGNVTYRGHLRLGESTYWMTNVEVKPARENITLIADLIEPPKNTPASNSIETVGRIKINTSSYMGELKGQGNLNIDKGQQVGNYQVLLDMQH